MSKKIDWTKPIRWVEGYRGENDGLLGLKVVFSQHGKTVVAWDAGLEIVDTYGCCGGKHFIENAPEEPVDTICLYRGPDGNWAVNIADVEGNSWDRKQVAPRSYWGEEDENHILVKVPS